MRRLVVICSLLVGLAVVLAPASGAAKQPALETVAISGEPGTKPTVTFPTPLAVKSSVSEVRAPGSGVKARSGSQVLLDYVLVNGRTGQEIETSFGQNSVVMALDESAHPTLRKALTGAAPGSRVVVAMAPKDGLAANGASVGVQKDDTILFVLDVKDVYVPLTRATGTKVAPKAGLPAVKLAKSGKPTITMPQDAPPARLVAQPLIEGEGPVVQAGQTIDVQYTGAIWGTGKVFDSSWKRGESVQFPIGAGAVIDGWDEGLVGQTVGSQVLLVIPPEKGYGAQGNAAAGIEGTDTLVFVVDILAAA